MRLFEGQQVVVDGLPAAVIVYVAIGEGVLHLGGERRRLRFLHPLAVVERDDFVRIVFEFIEQGEHGVVDVVALREDLLVVEPDDVPLFDLEPVHARRADGVSDLP